MQFTQVVFFRLASILSDLKLQETPHELAEDLSTSRIDDRTITENTESRDRQVNEDKSRHPPTDVHPSIVSQSTMDSVGCVDSGRGNSFDDENCHNPKTFMTNKHEDMKGVNVSLLSAIRRQHSEPLFISVPPSPSLSRVSSPNSLPMAIASAKAYNSRRKIFDLDMPPHKFDKNPYVNPIFQTKSSSISVLHERKIGTKETVMYTNKITNSNQRSTYHNKMKMIEKKEVTHKPSQNSKKVTMDESGKNTHGREAVTSGISSVRSNINVSTSGISLTNISYQPTEETRRESIFNRKESDNLTPVNEV